MKTSNTLCCPVMPYKRSGLHYFTKLLLKEVEYLLKIRWDLLQLIINPFAYILLSKTENEMTLAISKCLEPLCRQLLCKLHNKRYELLEKMGKTKQKYKQK